MTATTDSNIPGTGNPATAIRPVPAADDLQNARTRAKDTGPGQPAGLPVTVRARWEKALAAFRAWPVWDERPPPVRELAARAASSPWWDADAWLARWAVRGGLGFAVPWTVVFYALAWLGQRPAGPRRRVSGESVPQNSPAARPLEDQEAEARPTRRWRRNPRPKPSAGARIWPVRDERPPPVRELAARAASSPWWDADAWLARWAVRGGLGFAATWTLTCYFL